MKLYYAPQTRAIRPLIMLEELAVPYEIVLIDFKGGEHKSVAYRKIHPRGQMPGQADGAGTRHHRARDVLPVDVLLDGRARRVRARPRADEGMFPGARSRPQRTGLRGWRQDDGGGRDDRIGC